MSDYEEVDSFLEGHYHCIANEVEGKRECESSDALAVYLNEPDEGNDYFTAYCYSCNQSFSKEQVHGSSVGKELGVDGENFTINKNTIQRKPKAERITKVQLNEILSYGYLGKGIRNIKDEYSKFYGHVTKLDKRGNPIARYYPETRDGKVQGYKCRNFPKDFRFGKVGITGAKNDLSGQIKFKDTTFRDILIVGGEEDVAASMQMWMEYQKKRYKEDAELYNRMPIVSPTVGESGCLKQIREQYDFINQAENIYLGFDNDEVGMSAMNEIAKIFPKEKVNIIKWSHKDPNGYIYNKDGKDYSAQFIRDFYNAKPFVNMGIVTSQEADTQIEEELLRPKMSLPPFMFDLQKKMAGGIPLGYIVNWIAETGEIIAPCNRNITRKTV